MKKGLLNGFARIIYSSVLILAISVASAQVAPRITSFNPTSGPISTTVTVVGQNFNTILANNVVFFGATQGLVQSVVGSTTLTVRVPYGADYRYISVTDLSTGLTGYSARPFAVTLNPAGNNDFNPKATLSSGSGSSLPRYISTADLNGDSKPDLIIANSDNTVSIFPNQITTTTIASFGSAITLGTSSGSVSAALSVGDIDGDGKPDIAVVYSGTSLISVYRNTTSTPGATPSFAAASTFASNATPIAVSLGDLDGDGKPDLVVGCGIVSNNIYVLRNTSSSGSINFATYQIFTAGSNPSSVGIGDLDQDGKPDVVVSNKGANTVSVFRNISSLGSINLGSPSTLTSGTAPLAVAVGDFDGDTKLDLATANSGSDNVSVFLNTSTSGTISFANKADFYTGSGSAPSSLGLGDSDGDGNVDMIMANPGNSTSAILQNFSTIGSLSFSFNFGSFPTPPAFGYLGDLNADGKPDITLALSSLSNNTMVLLQKASQILTITSPSTMAVGTSMTATVTTTAADGGGGFNYNIFNGTGSAFVDPSTGLITANGVGTVILVVTSYGDTDYSQASVSQTILITKATPTLSILSPNTMLLGGSLTASVTTTATMSSGGVITFSITAGSGSATVNSTTGEIQATQIGTVTLIANAAGDSNYFPASTSQLLTLYAAPGGVGSGIKLWLRADAAVSSTVGGNVARWDDQSGSVTNTSNQATPVGGASTDIVLNATGLNYNPVVTFSGASAKELVGSGDFSFASSNTIIAVAKIAPITSSYFFGGVFASYITGQHGTEGPSLTEDNGGTAGAGRFYVDGSGCAVAASTNTNSPDVVTAMYANNSNSTGASLYLNGIQTIGGSGCSIAASSAMTFEIGGRTMYSGSPGDQNTRIIKGDVAEVVYFNRGVSTVERNQVQSYLAIKYGIHLDPTAVPNYLASDGSIIWGSVSNTGYTSTVMGIGLDNSSSLNQKQTKSASNADILTLGIGSITTSNSTNVGSFSADKSFLIVGSNGALTGSVTTTDVPASPGTANPIKKRLLRVWKPQNTGGVGAVELQFDLTGAFSGTNYQSSDVCLLIDRGNTGSFTSATVGGGSIALSPTLVGGASSTIYKFSGLMLNSGDRFTVALMAHVPVLTITSANTMTVGSSLTATVTTTATGGQGGAITFSITAGSGSATVNPNTGFITAVGAGTITLTTMSAGDANYDPATTSQLITIGKVTPTLSITSNNTMSLGESLTASVGTTASVSSGGAITYTIITGSGSATVDSNTGFITAIGTGTVTLVVMSSGDTNYNPATTSQLITITNIRGSQTLTITSATILLVGGSLTASVTTTAISSTGGVITYAITAGGSGSATVNSATGFVTALGAGTVTLMANSSGDINYNPASTTQVITIGQNTPTLTITSANVMIVDGTLTVTTSTTAIDGGGVLGYGVLNGSGSAAFDQSGSLRAISAGMVSITVTSSGNTNYYPASATQLITIDKGTPTLMITSPSTVAIGNSLTASVNTTATYGRGGAITYSVSAGSGSATVDSNTGFITGIGAGTLTLTAFAAGDADYNSAITSQLFTISRITPTLAITSANMLQVDGTLTATVTTTATVSSGGAITYAITSGSGSATVNPVTGLITALSVGTVTLFANAAGDTNYTAATTSQVITIGMTIPTFVITSANTMNVDGTLTATITTTASHDIGTLGYNITNGTGAAFVDPFGVIMALQAGTITLTVSSNGNADYNGTSLDQLITIMPGTQTLTMGVADTMTFGTSLTASVNTTATYGRGGDITFSIVAGSGSATVDTNTGLVTANGVGTVTLTAYASGDADYNPATISQLITIVKATPTLTITSANAMNVGDSLTATVTSTATSGGGGVITFAMVMGSGSATVDTNTGLIMALGAGTVTLTASSAGDSNYAAVTVSQLITISRVTPTLIITSASSLTVDDTLTAAVTTTATLSSGGAITFGIIGGSGSATVNGNTGLLTAIGAGTVTLTASVSGDTNYAPVSTSQLISIGQNTQALTITSASTLAVGDSLTITTDRTTVNGRGGVVVLTLIAGSGSATIDTNTGLLQAVSVGTMTLTASTLGDTNYFGATTSQLITIIKATPTLVFTSANSIAAGGMLTATVTTTAIGGRGGAITFGVIGGGSGSVTIDPNTGLITGVSMGSVTITATSTGDTNYNSTSEAQLFTVGKTTPTLTITSANMIAVDASLTITGTSSVGNQDIGVISFAVTSTVGGGSATVDTNGILTGINAGQVTLIVTSSGNTNYYPIMTTQAITVTKGVPILTITSANTLVVDQSMTATVTTTAMGGRGGSYSYAIVNGTGSATVDVNGVVLAVQVGQVTLTVGSSGDNDYVGASVQQLITIGKSTPTLTITSNNQVLVDGALTAAVTTTATHGGGGTYSYNMIQGSGSATVDSNGIVTGIDVGTATLIVTSSGDASYNSATTSQTITINKTTPTLTLTSGNTLEIGSTLTVTGFSSAGSRNIGPVGFAILAGSGSATVDMNGLLTAIGTGTVTLVVSSSGSGNYYPTTTSQTITITKVTQTLTITSASTLLVGGTLTATVSTTASMSSGGGFSYSIINGSGSATIDPNTGYITGVGAGTVTLVVNAAGDTNYTPATTSQLITITTGAQTLTITSANTLGVDQSLTVTVTTTAIGGRGGALSYTIQNGSGIATVSPSGVVTGVQAGSVTLVVDAAGDADYSPATTSQLIAITKATPTLTVTSNNIILVNTSLTTTVNTSATFGRGGALSYSIINGTGAATVDSNGLISATQIGSVTLVVSSAGDTSYYPATTSLGIDVASVTITSITTTLAEGQTGGFVISLLPINATLSSPINFIITTSSSNTASPAHYGVPLAATLPVGQNSVTVTVQAMTDTILYNDELLVLNFTNQALGTLTGTLTITDTTALDPNNLVITIGNATIYQNQTVSVVASLPDGITSATPIDIALAVGSASVLHLSSYSLPTTVTIGAGSSSVSFDVSASSMNIDPSILIIAGSATSTVTTTVGIRSVTYTVLSGIVIVNGQQISIQQAYHKGEPLQINGLADHLNNSVSVFNVGGTQIYYAEGYDGDTIAFRGRWPDGVFLPEGNYYVVVQYYDANGNSHIYSNFLYLK
ncbi:MAG: hypothetical protein E6Q66_06320 [Pedobacter sp.]|nr:MAG: hypothetical protein E6Q66_06320 [Pedobacter sp.]